MQLGWDHAAPAKEKEASLPLSSDDNRCQECDLMALKHTYNTSTMTFLNWPQLCLMLNSAVNRSVSWGGQLKSQFGDLQMIPDTEDASRRGPLPRLPGFCGGSGSADQHRFLPGLFECQHPDGWWLTRQDTCWLQVKPGLVQNRTWLTLCPFSSLVFSLDFPVRSFRYSVIHCDDV